jgi:glycosyltransferase involved in cell wall biosynthesis
MPKKNKVLYLISRENMLEPGVIKSQALDLIGQILKQDDSTEVAVLNFPSINRFLKYVGNYGKVREYCKNLGIKLVVIPILPVGRSIMPVWAMPFFLVQTVPWILFFMLKYRINIIHARAYLSALAVLFLKKIGTRVGFIFDMRAPYLLEGIVYGRWQKSDFDYRAWEGLEREMFSSSDSVVSQAAGMADYAKEVSPSANVVYIPNCVNPEPYKISGQVMAKERKKLGIEDRFVFVYSGSFGDLHPPDFIGGLYAQFRKYVPDPYFLVVTHSDPEGIIQSLFKLGVSEHEFKVLHNPPKLEEIIPLGDAGIGAMGGEIITTPLVMSVKVAEYLAAGLPLIVSPEMKSVADIVEKENCGVVIDSFDQNDIRVKMQKLVKERETLKKNALKLAQDYFSVRVCAEKYLEIYEKLNPKSKS